MLQSLNQCKKSLFLKTSLPRIITWPRKETNPRCFLTRRLCSVVGSPSSSIWLQVLQSGCTGTSAGLYIFTDSTRYLVNTGENTLRQLADNGLFISGLNKIFLTGSTINHIGGLINTLLTTQDRHTDDHPIDVYGPHTLEAYMHTTRRSFQYLSKFDFVKLSLFSERTSWQKVLKDEHFTIRGCFLNNEPSKKDDDVIYPRLNISYAFELNQPPRRLSVDAARELGVPEEMFHTVAEKCQMGSSVTLPCGKVINPNDVLCAPEPKQSFLVIDCPSQHVLKTLTQFNQSNIFNEDPDVHINLIIHITPLEIAGTPEYKTWMENFGPSTNHLLMNQEINSSPRRTFSGFDKVYEKLNEENTRLFPNLSYSLINSEFLKDRDFPSNVTSGLPSLKYIFRPYRLVGFEENAALSELGRSEKRGSDVQRRLTSDSCLNERNDFEVVFLGTGSRVSSILRNASGILVNMTGNVSLLMDCGEGTYRQMCHHYGEDVDMILKQLRVVFVSHMHVDHHLGLVNILLQRKKLVGDSDYVRIIGPESLDLFLIYIEMLIGESLNFRFTQFWWLKRGAGKKEGRLFSESLGLSSISVIPTKHSDYSHGVALERNGWKIVYSADTRPCKQLIDAGEGATLLIHEATFEDQLLERAKATSHCTVSEALRVRELMKAQYTILTHISSRHLFPCKVSRLPARVSFAFDHMTIQQKDLPTLHGMMPNLEKTVLHHHQGRKFPRKKLLKSQKNSRASTYP